MYHNIDPANTGELLTGWINWLTIQEANSRCSNHILTTQQVKSFSYRGANRSDVTLEISLNLYADQDVER